ncbi:MAG: divergent polysaccharide deacetylase family protein [Thalassotalea sp.]
MPKTFFITIIIALSTSLFSAISLAEKLQVVIVIDDIGYRKTDEAALDLPGNITFSVLPHTPYGQKLALQANRQNKDVLLHIPMESTIGKKLGPGALTSEMNETDFQQQLNKAFIEIPFAVGINNHMGSKLTQLYSPMAWTMRYLKQKEVMFLDSMTTKLSKGEEVAKLFGVPSLHRHVFLDNQLTEAYISQQFAQLIAIAQQNQYAVGIAHPHPETIAILTKLIPKLSELNIELVPISDIINGQNIEYKTAQITE